MRTIGMISAILLLAVIFLVVVSMSGDGATITVEDDGGADYTKIQDAVRNSADGDTILVYEGTYHENVVLDKSLNLIGENNETTIIQGSGSGNGIAYNGYSYGFSDISVKNFTIQGFRAGISIYYSGSVIISGNNISGNSLWSMSIFCPTSCSILGNTLSSNGVGIYMQYSKSTTIIGNTVSYNGGGMYLTRSISSYTIGNNKVVFNSGSGIHLAGEQSSGSTLYENNVSNNGYGIYLYGSGNNKLRNNTLTDNMVNFGVWGYLSLFEQDIDTSNTINGKPIYYWVGKSGGTVPLDAGYVGIVNSNNITVQDLTLSNNYQGVLVAFSCDTTIRNVTVSRNKEDGVYLYWSDNITIFDSNASNNGQSGINATYFPHI